MNDVEVNNFFHKLTDQDLRVVKYLIKKSRDNGCIVGRGKGLREGYENGYGEGYGKGYRKGYDNGFNAAWPG